MIIREYFVSHAVGAAHVRPGTYRQMSAYGKSRGPGMPGPCLSTRFFYAAFFTAFFFQAPLTNRATKHIMRQIQSTTMAYQTPTAPIPICTQSTQLRPMRQTSIEAVATTIVNRTSLAARRALGSTKLAGQRKIYMPLWIMTSVHASARVSGVRVYMLKIWFRDSSTTTLTAPWAI